MLPIKDYYYEDLIDKTAQLLEKGREKAVKVVHFHLVQTHWEIGRHIIEYEQKVNKKQNMEQSYLSD